MPVFKLEVYRNTRKSEQVFVERIFTSESSQIDLYNKFNKEYSGFLVRVQQLENIDIVNIDKPSNNCENSQCNSKPVVTSSLEIEIKFTCEENKIRATIDELRGEIKSLTNELDDSVKKRYENTSPKLGYVNKICCYPKPSYRSPYLSINLYKDIESVTEYIQDNSDAVIVN